MQGWLPWPDAEEVGEGRLERDGRLESWAEDGQTGCRPAGAYRRPAGARGCVDMSCGQRAAEMGRDGMGT